MSFFPVNALQRFRMELVESQFGKLEIGAMQSDGVSDVCAFVLMYRIAIDKTDLRNISVGKTLQTYR
jgi:hypothetical protein